LISASPAARPATRRRSTDSTAVDPPLVDGIPTVDIATDGADAIVDRPR